jgi:hypothetical protein
MAELHRDDANAKTGKKPEKKAKEPTRKIGAGSWEAWKAQGWSEIRALLYPDSNIAQPAAYGMWGTQTQGEVAEGRRPKQEPVKEDNSQQKDGDEAAKDAEASEAKKDRSKWWQRLFGRFTDRRRDTAAEHAGDHSIKEVGETGHPAIDERLNRSKERGDDDKKSDEKDADRGSKDVDRE